MKDYQIKFIEKYCLLFYKCDIFLLNRDKRIIIGSLKSLNPQKGNGRNCLKFIINICIKFGIEKIQLTVQPLDELNNNEDYINMLEQFYFSEGFRRVNTVNKVMEIGLNTYKTNKE